MSQIVLLIAAGAGLLLVKRALRNAQERAAADLRRAKEAMADRSQREHTVTQLERDPATGIYRPKQ